MPHTAPFRPTSSGTPFGAQLREWRQRRRRSQLDLALDAGISQRHLSFVESGRAAPSRDMVLLLAEELDVPLRERNAPRYATRALEDAALAPAHAVIDAILRAHAPNPALVVDRHWHMVAANAGVPPLLAGVADPGLLQPPVNVLRLSLHPHGLAPAIANLPAWRAHILTRLRRQAHASGDPALAALLAELRTLGDADAWTEAVDNIAIPLELDTPAGRLSLISTVTVFGTPAEVTLSELAIEAFYPADDATAARLLQLQRVSSAGS